MIMWRKNYKVDC